MATPDTPFYLRVHDGVLKETSFADIGMINVLIGPNNSGKTTFLRAIYDKNFWIGHSIENSELFLGVERHAGTHNMRVNPHPALNCGTDWTDQATLGSNLKNLKNDKAKSAVDSIALAQSPMEFTTTTPLYMSHRRKSLYECAYGHVARLDSDCQNLAGRVSTIRAETTHFQKIEDFVTEVVPGCGSITAQGSDTSIVIHVGGILLNLVGGGVEQTLAIAVALIAEDPNAVLLIEEPETNLHPSSQRILVKKILEHRGNRRLFITTHSPTIMNELVENGGQIYRLTPKAWGSSISPEKAPENLRAALDSVGARASDILQANCVIWVEGPTEMIVLRYLISLFYPETFQEHRDFEFLFTAGSLIVHVDGDVDPDSPLIDALRICRHGVVVVDRDNAPCAEMAKSNRLVNSVDFFVTEPYEFEWYFPQSLVEEVLGKDISSIYTNPGIDAFVKVLARIDPRHENMKKAKRAQDVIDASEKHADKLQLWKKGAFGKDLAQLLEMISQKISSAKA